ncbi:MAG TPA: hypothetical protein VFU02_03470, partial [Polyangiaceae bacterium]|nr:hypothetical protein [Polyangiaceae bacterium]
KPSMAENRFLPSERLHHYRWLELIDFSSKRRLRTDRVFEAELTETGIAVGIEPAPAPRLAALDWPATCPSP